MTVFDRRSLLRAALVLPTAAFAGEKDYNITAFGATPSQTAPQTAAIQRAIDTCAEAGGGRVVIPAGTFLSGGLELRGGVNFHLSEGAVLLGSPWFRDYPQHPPRNPARYGDYLLTSLLYAERADRISVTGKGVLDGNSRGPNDFYVNPRKGQHRPCLIWFDECTNVAVSGITFTSSGFWTEAYTRCRNVHVSGITVKDSIFHNNDGCDIVDCENAIVENCNIDALDDGICLKGYTAEGCRNVIIRNNRVRSSCNGIKAGTDSSGGFQNILIENNTVWQTGIAGLALELVDGGVMRNVIVRNLNMDVVETPIFLKLGNRNRRIATPSGPVVPGDGVLEDIHISGIRAKVNRSQKSAGERKIHDYAAYASSITGHPGHSIERVYIRDVDIEILGGYPEGSAPGLKQEIPEKSTKYPENRMFGHLPAHAFYIRHARNIHLSGIRVKMSQPDPRPAFVLDDVTDSTFLGIQTESVTRTPAVHKTKSCHNVKFTAR